MFDLLLRYATSEDGALHAEKYYRTVTEEFAAMRPAFQWGQLVALARDRELVFIHAVGGAPLVDPPATIQWPRRSVRAVLEAGVDLVIVRGVSRVRHNQPVAARPYQRPAS